MYLLRCLGYHYVFWNGCWTHFKSKQPTDLTTLVTSYYKGKRSNLVAKYKRVVYCCADDKLHETYVRYIYFISCRVIL